MHKKNKWIAGLLGLFLAPIGLLYVEAWRSAFVYFLLQLALGILRLSGMDIAPWLIAMAGLVIALAAMMQSFLMARKVEFSGRWYGRWYSLATIIVAIVFPVLAFRMLVYEPYRIPADSMAPTLKAGDVIFVEKIGFGSFDLFGLHLGGVESSASIKRGDVVLFHPPMEPTVLFIKRVVGLPGDRISYKNKELYINDKKVAAEKIGSLGDAVIYRETFFGQSYCIQKMPSMPSFDIEISIPEENYFVLGDNRDNSNDSRYWGFVPKDMMVGLVEVSQRCGLNSQ